MSAAGTPIPFEQLDLEVQAILNDETIKYLLAQGASAPILPYGEDETMVRRARDVILGPSRGGGAAMARATMVYRVWGLSVGGQRLYNKSQVAEMFGRSHVTIIHLLEKARYAVNAEQSETARVVTGMKNAVRRSRGEEPLPMPPPADNPVRRFFGTPFPAFPPQAEAPAPEAYQWRLGGFDAAGNAGLGNALGGPYQQENAAAMYNQQAGMALAQAQAMPNQVDQWNQHFANVNAQATATAGFTVAPGTPAAVQFTGVDPGWGAVMAEGWGDITDATEPPVDDFPE